MRGPILIALLVLAGFGLGLVFYGGLWMTVRALPKSEHPIMLSLLSFWGRTALVITGLVWAMARRWQNAVACLAGFALARIVLAWLVPAHGAASRGA